MSQGKVWGLAVLMLGPLAVASLRAETSTEIIAQARALHSVGRRDEALQAIQVHLQANGDDTDVRRSTGPCCRGTAATATRGIS
jgi:predicted lipoprotein